MDGLVRSRQRSAVLADLGVPFVTSEPTRIRRLSAVERLRLRDGSSRRCLKRYLARYVYRTLNTLHSDPTSA